MHVNVTDKLYKIFMIYGLEPYHWFKIKFYLTLINSHIFSITLLKKMYGVTGVMPGYSWYPLQSDRNG